MTTPTFVAATSSSTTGKTFGLTLNVPAGVQQGDLLIAHLEISDPSSTWDTPTGWTLLRQDTDSTGLDGAIFTKTAGASEPASYQFTSTGYSDYLAGGMSAYRNAKVDVHAATIYTAQTTTYTAPSVSASGPCTVLRFFSAQCRPSTTPAGTTSRYIAGYSTMSGVELADSTQTAGGATGTASLSESTPSYGIGATVTLVSPNSPPNAPSWVTPQNSVIPADADYTLQWQFSDPDSGDSQSAFNLKRWALDASGNRVGSAVTVYSATPNQFYKITAGTLTAGTKYEFQVDTLDSQGAEGPYSASLFVTAANTPSVPTITDPTSGATIGTSSYTFTISAPNVDTSEWTLYADNGSGGIDTSTVLAGPDTVTTGDLRSHTFTGLANNTAVWPSVRIKYQGLWSQPAQQRNPVSYTPPAAVVLTATPDAATGSLLLNITNPAPGAGEPTTSYNNVYVDDGLGAGKEMVATMLSPNTAWRYMLPVSGRDYSGNAWVEAVGTNGVATETTL